MNLATFLALFSAAVLLRTLSRVTKEPEAREHYSTGSLVAGQDYSKRTPITKKVGTIKQRSRDLDQYLRALRQDNYWNYYSYYNY